jgi:hypothetical protein
MRVRAAFYPTVWFAVGAVCAAWFIRAGAGEPQQAESRPAALAEAASDVYRRYTASEVETRKIDTDSLYRWSVRWMEAERAAGKRAAASEAHLKRMRELEQSRRQWVVAGQAPAVELAAVRFFVLEAEQLVAKDQGR